MTREVAIATLMAALMLGAAPATSLARSQGGAHSANQGASTAGGPHMQTEPDTVGAINKSRTDSNDPGLQVRCPSKGSNMMEKNGTKAARSAANCK